MLFRAAIFNLLKVLRGGGAIFAPQLKGVNIVSKIVFLIVFKSAIFSTEFIIMTLTIFIMTLTKLVSVD